MLPKLKARDTRADSHRARREHGKHEATQHGWDHDALPLRAQLGELLAAKADELLSDAAADLRDAWRAAAEAKASL